MSGSYDAGRGRTERAKATEVAPRTPRARPERDGTALAVETIYHYPLDYELEVASEQVQDVPFWTDLTQREHPHLVLEIGCGTGRITLPLARVGAQCGFSLIGLDLEAAMLARARERAQAETDTVQGALRFVQADARTFALEERFEVEIGRA